MNPPAYTTANMTFEITLRMSETEAATLRQLFRYGHEALIKAALTMGSALPEVHGYEKAMSRLFEKTTDIDGQLKRIEKTRKAFNET